VDVDQLKQIAERARVKVEESEKAARHRLYKPMYDRQLLSLTPQQVESIKADKTPEQAADLDATLESLRKKHGG
jgi:hypothetical protein